MANVRIVNISTNVGLGPPKGGVSPKLRGRISRIVRTLISRQVVKIVAPQVAQQIEARVRQFEAILSASVLQHAKSVCPVFTGQLRDSLVSAPDGSESTTFRYNLNAGDRQQGFKSAIITYQITMDLFYVNSELPYFFRFAEAGGEDSTRKYADDLQKRMFRELQK